MKKVHFKKLTALVLAFAMLFSLVGTIGALAEREYAAELSINGAIVDFKNEPYSKFNTVFVPIEELCGYIGIDITRNGNTYTIKRMRDTLTMDVENIVININGKTVLLENGLTDRGGVTYAPVEIFSEGFKCPVTLSEDFRSADIQPNIYSVVINQDNAAAISAALPDKDTLVVSDSGADQLFYKPEESPEKEIAVFYKADLSDFADKKIASASLNLHVARGTNLHQSIAVQRTKPWNKGELNFSNQPAFYEGQQVNVAIPSELEQSAKNWGDMQFNITSLVNSAIGDGEALSVKLLGVPFISQKNPGTPQAHVKGVNTTTPPYISIEVNENFIFPVKKVETASVDESRFDELQILRSLGVFTEEDEFPLDLSESVTRGEFLTYAMRLRGKNIPVGSSEQFFSDVPTDNGYFAVTSSAYELGYISGWQGIAFRPYDAITVGEAVTILGRMLNYDVYADERGGFTPGYFQAAAHGDLYVGINDSITRLSFKQMFRLLEDALDAKMLNVYSYSSNGSAQYTFDENMTILTEFWNAEKIEGQITANEYSNIVPNGAYSEGYITITTGTGATKTLRLNYEPYNSLLGFRVKGYYEKHENVLLYIGTVSSDSTTVSLIDCDSIYPSNGGVSLKYSKDGKSSRTESFTVGTDVNIIYNGEALTGINKTAEKIVTLLNAADGGSVTIVGKDLVVITAYRTVVVSGVHIEEEQIYDEYVTYNNMLILKNKDYTIADTEGKKVALEDIQKHDVLSVAESLDKEYISAILTRRTITGKIESLENDGTAERILTIKGMEYKTANLGSGDWKKGLYLNAEGTFLLNHEGIIVGMDTIPTKEILGYIVALAESGRSPIRKKLQAAIMVQGSEKYVVYDLADSVKIDNVKFTEADKIEEYFRTDKDGTDTGSIIRQGIVFSLNDVKKINVIDTFKAGTEQDSEATLQKRSDISDVNQWGALVDGKGVPKKAARRTAGGLDNKANGRLSNKFYWYPEQSLSVIIPTKTVPNSPGATPSTIEVPDYDNIDKFMVTTSGVGNDEVINAEVYSIGERTPYASIVVVHGYNPGSGATSSYIVVDRVVTTYNDEGYEVKKLYYYSKPDDKKGVLVEEGKDNIVSTLNRGDIIRIGTNARGELSAVSEHFDYTTKTITESGGFTEADWYFGGYTSYIYDTFINVESQTEGRGPYWVDTASTKEKFNFYRYEVSSSGVTLYNAALADVRTLEDVPHNPTGMLMEASYASMNNTTAFLVDMNEKAGEGLYTVTYEPNLPQGAFESDLSGFPYSDPNRYNSDKTFTAFDNAGSVITLKDYELIGWINKDTGDEYALGQSNIPVRGSTTLLAKWKYNPTYTFTFTDTNDGVTGTPELCNTYAKDYPRDKAGTNEPNVINLPTYQQAKEAGFLLVNGDPKTDHELIGWKSAGTSYSLGQAVPVTGNMTFTAVWAESIQYTFKFIDTDGTTPVMNKEEPPKAVTRVSGKQDPITGESLKFNLPTADEVNGDGRTLTGWKGEDNTPYLPGAEYTVNASYCDAVTRTGETFTPVWTIEPLEVLWKDYKGENKLGDGTHFTATMNSVSQFTTYDAFCRLQGNTEQKITMKITRTEATKGKYKLYLYTVHNNGASGNVATIRMNGNNLGTVAGVFRGSSTAELPAASGPIEITLNAGENIIEFVAPTNNKQRDFFGYKLEYAGSN